MDHIHRDEVWLTVDLIVLRVVNTTRRVENIYIKRMFRTLSGRKRFFVAFEGIGEWKSGNDSL